MDLYEQQIFKNNVEELTIRTSIGGTYQEAMDIAVKKELQYCYGVQMGSQDKVGVLIICDICKKS